MHVRRVQLETNECSALLALDRKTFAGDTPIDPTNAHWWIAWDGSSPVGFIGYSRHGKTSKLLRVGVLPQARGQGLQRRMMRLCEHDARSHGSTVMLAYTAQYNIPSMVNLLKRGYLPYQPRRSRGRKWVHWRLPL